jgi:Tol biopolymer transport system component
MRSIAVITLALLFLVADADRTVAQTGHDLFQQALVKERADGDLRGAIAIYERIAREFAEDRALAAKALVQMGRCHEKLGNEDAQRAYRRVVREYPDQTDMVAEARGRLTALERLATPPAFIGRPSLDGRHVVYTDWATGDIAIRDLRTNEVRRVTTTGSQVKPIQFGMDPAFSPDGKYVVYEWHHPDSRSYWDLRIAPADRSGSPRVLYDTTGFNMLGPSWSRDGQHIAIARYPTDESRTDLLWVSVNDGSVRVLDTYAVSGYQGLSHSPDDRYVVYSVRRRGEPEQHDIHIAATDGSGSRPVVQHPSDDRLLGWVPGTDWVLFLGNRASMWGAWAIRVVDGQAQGEPQLVHPGMGQAWPRGFTEAGEFHYGLPVRWFTTYVASLNVVSGEIDTANAEPLPRSTMTPKWSPDGSRLAFLEERSHFQATGYVRPLRILDMATGEVRELADDVSSIRWSPDGRFVIASAFDHSVEAPDYHGGIYRIDVQTGDVQLLMALPRVPAWWMGTAGAISADGKSLFYLLRSVEKQGQEQEKDGLIVRRDLATGAEQELYRDPNLLGDAFEISPSGRLLVFAVEGLGQGDRRSSATIGAHLMLLDLATSEVRELVRVQVHGSVDLESVAWANDDRYVIYPEFTDSRKALSLWRVAAEGGKREKVAETSARTGAISPDGSRIAYTRGDVNTKSMVMENLKAVLAGMN